MIGLAGKSAMKMRLREFKGTEYILKGICLGNSTYSCIECYIISPGNMLWTLLSIEWSKLFYKEIEKEIINK